ncbi:MAG: Stress response protein nst1 [Thelocarpon superellum]|nr:MAG: Stress response protein nst1 [Thelocarpon superellum]
MSAPPGLPTPAFAPTTPSPHLQITTPAIPKAPAPIRPRQASQQGSVGSSPRTPHVAAGAGQTLSPGSAALPQQSPGPVGPPGKATGHPTSTILAPVAPAAIVSPPGMPLPSTTGFPGLPSLAHSHLPSSQAPMAPPLTQRASVSHDMSTYAHAPPTSGPSSRAFSSPTAAPFHPSTVSMAHAGSSAVRTAPPARGIYADETSPLSQPTAAGPMGSSVGMASFNAPRATMPTHSRQQSASFDPTTFDVAGPVSQTQPIARPTPIQRPRPDELHWPSQSDMDDLSSHLGSSALLDDTDDAFPADAAAHRRGSAAPGLPGPPTTRSRFSFGPSMFTPSIGRTSDLDRAPGRANVGIEGKMDGATLGNPPAAGDNWGTPHLPFGAPGLPSTTTWTNNPGSFFGPAAPRRPQLATEDGAAWASTSSYGIIGGPHRPTLSRPVTVRLLICQACKQLAGLKKPGDVFHEVSTLLHQVDQIRPAGEGQVTPQELLDICETEGDAHNGGGYFTVKHDGPGKTYVKHEQDGNTPGSTRGSLAPGEIGSPLSGTIPPFGGARPFQPASGVTSPSSGS